MAVLELSLYISIIEACIEMYNSTVLCSLITGYIFMLDAMAETKLMLVEQIFDLIVGLVVKAPKLA